MSGSSKSQDKTDQSAGLLSESTFKRAIVPIKENAEAIFLYKMREKMLIIRPAKVPSTNINTVYSLLKKNPMAVIKESCVLQKDASLNKYTKFYAADMQPVTKTILTKQNYIQQITPVKVVNKSKSQKDVVKLSTESMPLSESRFTLKISGIEEKNISDISTEEMVWMGLREIAGSYGEDSNRPMSYTLKRMWNNQFGDGSYESNPLAYLIFAEVIHSNFMLVN